MVDVVAGTTVAGRSSAVCTMYQVAFESHFQLSTLVISVVKSAKKARPASRRLNASFYFGLLWGMIMDLPPPQDQSELSVRKITVFMLQVYGQGRIGELRGLWITGEVDPEYCRYMSNDPQARRFRVFNFRGAETTVSPTSIRDASRIVVVFQGTKAGKFAMPVEFRRLREALVGSEVASQLDLFAYLGDYAGRVAGRSVLPRGGLFEHSQSHALQQLSHGNGTFVSTEVDPTSGGYYYVTETTLSGDIGSLFSEAAVPDGFTPYASRGNSESLLFDADKRYRLFVNFEDEICAARSRHSFSQFKSTYYNPSDDRHVSAIQSLSMRASRLRLKLRVEELLVWFSKDLNRVFEGDSVQLRSAVSVG